MIRVTVAAEKNIRSAVVSVYRPRLLDFKIFIALLVVIIFALVLSRLEAANILDVRFYYNEIEFQKFFQTLSAKEHFRYILVASFDLCFLISYSVFFFLCLKRLTYKKPLFKYLGFLPGIFDLVETGSILAVLTENVPIKSVSWIGYMTALKWVFVISILLIIFAGIYFRIAKNKPMTSSLNG